MKKKVNTENIRLGDSVILFGGIPHEIESISEDFFTGRRMVRFKGCFGWYSLDAFDIDGIEPREGVA